MELKDFCKGIGLMEEAADKMLSLPISEEEYTRNRELYIYAGLPAIHTMYTWSVTLRKRYFGTPSVILPIGVRTACVTMENMVLMNMAGSGGI